MELRVRGFSIAIEIVVALLLTWFGSLFAVVASVGQWDTTLIRMVFLVSLLSALVALRDLRWRRRILLDDTGVRWLRSKNDAGRRLAWRDVDELFILGFEEFELRGAGTSILFTPAYDRVGEARDFVSHRLGGLRDRLRDQAMRQGELHFRMPGGRGMAHAFYLAVVLVMTGVTAMVVVPILKGEPAFPFLLVALVVGGFIWKLRHRVSRMGTIVTLYRDGILVRRLDGSRKIGWSTVTATEWNEQGGLDILQAGGRRLSLPPQLANVTLLEGFIDEARSGPPNS